MTENDKPQPQDQAELVTEASEEKTPGFAELGLNERLQKAVEAAAYSQPTPVQAATIPQALTEKDLLVSAETGSGKTAAFILPILHKFMAKAAPNSGTRALILVPTRELARQVFKNCKELAAFSKIEAGILTGGDQFKYQSAMLRKNPEIIIATPGRMLEHVVKKSADLKDLEVLVLDEADIMLDMGLSEDVLKIVAACNPQRQSLLFSATLENKHVKRVAAQTLNEPQKIVLSTAKDQHSNITQQMILSDDDKLKEKQLSWLLENESDKKALVFTNTRAMAQKLCGYLRYRDHQCDALHGEMSQDQRNHVMDRFRRGRVKVLVATDVAARGLDIKNVDLVVNFDMAQSGDDYVHRIGRTGRAGEQGLAISLIAPNEWNLKASIERYLRIKLESRVIDSLKAAYKGPAKVKSSGKAAGKKKKPADKAKVKSSKKKTEQNKRPSAKSGTVKKSRFGSNDGSAPLKRK